ncbi:MAG: TIGR03617 family F420-dependent LLM class oxidoreductase [Halobacteria archaeon]
METPKLDASLNGLNADPGERASTAEEMGFDGVWNPELSYDSFLPLTLAAEHTDDIEVGTRITTAFTQSPMVLAYTGWDLARYSEGRFVLSLGTQVKAHNERRFSVDWSEPTQRLREVVESIRHIWRYWQGDEDEFLYEGDHYSFSLMSTVFNPGAIENPDIPIYTAGVNEGNVKLAGEISDGICLHSFNSPKYTEEKIKPWLEEGAEEAGRDVDEVTISASPFVITGKTDKEMKARREMVRMRIAFYGSTPSYKPVMQTHGWEDVGRELWELSKDQAWSQMMGLVTEEMIDTFAIQAPLDEIADEVKSEYAGVADRVMFDMDEGFEGQDFWQDVVDEWYS